MTDATSHVCRALPWRLSDKNLPAMQEMWVQWVRAGSGSWWWTGKPGVLQSMGWKRVEHDWVNWTVITFTFNSSNINTKLLNLFNLLHGLRRGFLRSSVGKVSACSEGDPASIPGLGRSPGEGNATHCSVVAWRIPWTEEPGYRPWGHKSQTRLSD